MKNGRLFVSLNNMIWMVRDFCKTLTFAAEVSFSEVLSLFSEFFENDIFFGGVLDFSFVFKSTLLFFSKKQSFCFSLCFYLFLFGLLCLFTDLFHQSGLSSFNFHKDFLFCQLT